jgi:hypothetical protein
MVWCSLCYSAAACRSRVRRAEGAERAVAAATDDTDTKAGGVRRNPLVRFAATCRASSGRYCCNGCDFDPAILDVKARGVDGFAGSRTSCPPAQSQHRGKEALCLLRPVPPRPYLRSSRNVARGVAVTGTLSGTAAWQKRRACGSQEATCEDTAGQQVIKSDLNRMKRAVVAGNIRLVIVAFSPQSLQL